MPAELNKPVGTLTDRPSNPLLGSTEGHFNNIGVAQVKRIDPLEHNRYGEGNNPSTNESPVPVPLTQPLNITNIKDEHDFKMPYNPKLKGDYKG
jgi:hypothetical protein